MTCILLLVRTGEGNTVWVTHPSPVFFQSRKIEPLGITRRRHSSLGEQPADGLVGRKDIAWTVGRRLPPDSSGESNDSSNTAIPVAIGRDIY